MKVRSEIEQQYKWDLSKFCESDQKFYEKLENALKQAEEFKKYEGKLSDDKVLFEYLEKKSEFCKGLYFASYAYYRQCEDNAAREGNDMMERRSMAFAKINKIFTAIDVQIDKFSAAKLKALQNNAKFKNYKRDFEAVLRHKKHTLSKKEELLLSHLSEFTGGFEDNFEKFNYADLKFQPIADGKGKKHEFSEIMYSTYARSSDRVLRENAFKEVNGRRGEYINFLAANYASDVKEDCVFAKLRKYKSALDAALYSEEISSKVYEMLIKKVRQNINLMERYFEIKRKMLGQKDIAIYDMFAPVVKASSKKYSYEEAIELIKKAVAPLGEEYVALVQRAKDERWIDVFPNKNKYTGAYSSGNYGITPVILTNFQGQLDDVFTLAHELGHAMHSYYSAQNQPIQTHDYVIFVAEVASTTNEMLLLQYLLKTCKTPNQKFELFDHFLQQVRSTIFRQTMFAEFEEFAHAQFENDNPLSAELLCQKYKALNDFYHGKKCKQITEMKYEWARIPHFFESFYVYKYATGLVSAIKISSKILKENGFAKKYIKFLSSGCKTDPINLLRIADCDLEKEEAFDEAFETTKQFLSQWEALVAQLNAKK